MQHILGHAEHEEILLREDLGRTWQACASCRSEAQSCQLIMWREALANASKGVSQSLWRGLKAGREAALRHLWVEGLPYPRTCREIPSPSATGEVAPQLCAPRAPPPQDLQHQMFPKVSGVPWSALSDQKMGVDWVMMQSCRQCRRAERCKLCLSGQGDFADMLSRQANLLWCTSTALYIRQSGLLLQGSAYCPLQSHRKAFQLKAHKLTSCFLLSQVHFKAQHGFWCSYLTLAKQAEIYIFVLLLRRPRRWAPRS